MDKNLQEHTETIIKYANLLLHGIIVEKNKDEAIKLLNIAINLGNSNAINDYATFLLNEDPNKKENILESFELYERAIKLNNTIAMINMSHILLNGTIVEQNITKGIKLLHDAIKLRNTNAMFILAHYYIQGKFVPKNFENAIKLFEMSIENGMTESYYDLAKVIYDYLPKNEKNTQKVMKLLDISIGLNNDNAMNEMANILYDRENKLHSIELYKKAIELGNVNAMVNLAIIYENDSTQSTKAIELYKMAAEQDDIEAITKLAEIYSKGIIVDKNIGEAIKYYDKAIELGDKTSIEKLSKLMES